MKPHLVLAVHAIVVAGSSPDVLADDYQTLEDGLQKSSLKINDVHLPGIVYSIDRQTASQYSQRYFGTHRYNRWNTVW